MLILRPRKARPIPPTSSGIIFISLTAVVRTGFADEGKIVQYLDDMELKVSEAISRQVELWKQTDSCYQKAVLSGDAEKMLCLENCFVYMAREAVFGCMVYI